jgi:hypothetical protein
MLATSQAVKWGTDSAFLHVWHMPTGLQHDASSVNTGGVSKALPRDHVISKRLPAHITCCHRDGEHVVAKGPNKVQHHAVVSPAETISRGITQKTVKGRTDLAHLHLQGLPAKQATHC